MKILHDTVLDCMVYAVSNVMYEKFILRRPFFALLKDKENCTKGVGQNLSDNRNKSLDGLGLIFRISVIDNNAVQVVHIFNSIKIMLFKIKRRISDKSLRKNRYTKPSRTEGQKASYVFCFEKNIRSNSKLFKILLVEAGYLCVGSHGDEGAEL